jgi:hypothetical protein
MTALLTIPITGVKIHSAMTPELKTALRIINEQSALVEALVVVLASHGVIDRNEVKAKHAEKLRDPQRAFALFETFQQYLQESQRTDPNTDNSP